MEPYQKIFAKNNDEGLSLTNYLSACENGADLIVIGVNAGFRAKKRLADLRVVPGVKIIKKKSLVKGRALALKVLVNCEKTYEL